MRESTRTAGRIAVVGGGVSGLAVAARLAQSGLPVTLFEAAKLGSSSSTRNQGWLHSGAWFAPERLDLAQRMLDAHRRTLAFCPECVEPGHAGMWYLSVRPDTRHRNWTDAWTAAGIPFSAVDVSEVQSAIPEFAPGLVQHAWLLPDRAIRVDVLLDHLAAAAANAGAELRPETPIVELRRSDGHVESVVTGTGEEVAVRFVILAGGAAGLDLRAPFSQAAPGAQPACTAVALKAHLVSLRPHVAEVPFCAIDADGFHHVPHLPVSVLGSARWITVPNPKDQHVVPQEMQFLWERIGTFFPKLDRARHEIREWAGTTVQALQPDQIEPGRAPYPSVVDHAHEHPPVGNLLCVFPGRATLWSDVAETARRLVLEKLETPHADVAPPPWS